MVSIDRIAQNILLFSFFLSHKILDLFIQFVNNFNSKIYSLYNYSTSVVNMFFNFENDFIFMFDIIFVVGFILFCGIIILDYIYFFLYSGKAKKTLEIGSKIATIVGTIIAAKSYNDSLKDKDKDKSGSGNNSSNSRSNSGNNDSKSKSGSKSKSLVPILATTKLENRYKSLSILPLLGIILPENPSDVNVFAYLVLGISLVILWTLINVLGYLSAVYILSISNFENKYPKLSYLFKYFKYSSLLFVVIQGIICILSTITLIILSFYFIN